MKTEISGVISIEFEYTWSQKGVSYFISTCGNNCLLERIYKSKFENEFGSVTFKEISRPEIAEFLYEYIPLIDGHNKFRKGILNMDKCWPTK